MNASKCSARQGWGWLGEGFRLFRRSPAQLAFIVFIYWLLVAFINALPLLGPLLAALAVPAFSVGLMGACRELDRTPPAGGALRRPVLLLLPQLFAAFRGPQIKTLLLLGALYLAVSLLAIFAASLVDGGVFMRSFIGNQPASRAEIASGDLLLGMQVTLLFMLPAIMAWWFAPLLVAWHGQGAAKALFFSLMASWRNWPAFLAYGLSVMVFAALLPGLLLGVLAAVLPGATVALASLVLVPLLLVLAPSLVASAYVSYREVFAGAAPLVSEHA